MATEMKHGVVSIEIGEDKKKRTADCLMHRSIRDVMLLGQCVGLLPVKGITKPDVRSLRFSIYSKRVYYSFILIISGFSCVCFSIMDLRDNGFRFEKLTDCFFNVSILMITVLYLKLAFEWPKLMKEWAVMEYAMESYGRPKYMTSTIRQITVFVMILAIVEFSIKTWNQASMAISCWSEKEDVWKIYFHDLFLSTVFEYLPYHVLIGVYFQIIKIFQTIVWNYVDVFIMVMSTGLSQRFGQINKRLYTTNIIKMSNDFWRILREDYNRICIMCRILDDTISNIILISFANNMYFILVQFFNTLRPMDNTAEKIYFAYSFSFLIGRTFAVSIIAAKVNEESLEPLVFINTTPYLAYCEEMNRLSKQIKFDCAALTGKKMFRVTKRLIISLAGAVVTYELVLIQFNDNSTVTDTKGDKSFFAINVTKCS